MFVGKLWSPNSTIEAFLLVKLMKSYVGKNEVVKTLATNGES